MHESLLRTPTRGDIIPISGITPWGIDRVSLTAKLRDNPSAFSLPDDMENSVFARYEIPLGWMSLIIDQKTDRIYVPFNAAKWVRGNNLTPATITEFADAVQDVIPNLLKIGFELNVDSAKVSHFETARIFRPESDWDDYVNALMRYVDTSKYQMNRRRAIATIANSNWMCKTYLQRGNSGLIKLEITSKRGRVHQTSFGELLSNRESAEECALRLMRKNVDQCRKMLGYHHVI